MMQLFKSMRMKTKLMVLLLVFGLIPAFAVFGMFMASQSKYEHERIQPMAEYAQALMDAIDANLFERYGDVQAFALNTAAYDASNWGDQSETNPLIRAMNGYMSGYGIYDLMMLVDTDGNVLATNTRDANGRSANTAFLYNQSMANETWFRNAMSGNFLNGRNGFTGTAVTQPKRSQLVSQAAGTDGYTMAFAAPVTDMNNQKIGVWVNFASFDLVQGIVESMYKGMAEAAEFKTIEMTIIDPEGNVLVDYDPNLGRTFATGRDFNTVGKLNLVQAGVEAARDAVAGGHGAELTHHARKDIMQAAGFAHAKGAYDYPGMDWSALVRVDEAEMMESLWFVRNEMIVALVIFAALVLVAGFFFGNMASRPVVRMTSMMGRLANNDLSIEIDTLGKDEMGDMSRALEVFKKAAVEREEKERQTAIMQSCLTNLQNNVMIADENDNFTYMNDKSFQSLRDLEPTIRQLYPSFSVDNLLGTSIHQMHKDPEAVKRVIGSLQKGTIHNARIKLGELTLELKVGPIYQGDKRIGTYAEWQDVTHQIVNERQAAIMQSCLTSLQNNVMIADENDDIQYMNDKSLESLRELTPQIRQAFPDFDVEKVMGASIHNMHKNPDRIRTILRGLKQGEIHKGKINIGELTLALNAGPIFQNGTRVGSYAEWSDITQQEADIRRKAELERSVNDVATRINDATQDIAQGNSNLSERTEAQAASLEETTATMQQVTERVNQNATNAKEALSIAGETRTAADRGGAVVQNAIQAMEEINASSTKINDIIGVIDEIAFQTNLLALNAAVEAARAGEQGRGFAVVASEVRTLAGRSAKAAREIKDLITESVSKIRTGSEQVDETGQCLGDIITSVQKVTDMVNEISDASQEQAESIAEINKSVSQMDSFTQQNASLVEEAASASSALAEQSNTLIGLMNGESDAHTKVRRRTGTGNGSYSTGSNGGRKMTAAEAEAEMMSGAPVDAGESTMNGTASEMDNSDATSYH